MMEIKNFIFEKASRFCFLLVSEMALGLAKHLNYCNYYESPDQGIGKLGGSWTLDGLTYLKSNSVGKANTTLTVQMATMTKLAFFLDALAVKSRIAL